MTRQNTVQHLQPETSVAAACQSLWAAKGHLEELQALGISDPSSASTSFESNTDNSPSAGNPDTKAVQGISDPSSASTSFESNTDNSPSAGNPDTKAVQGADKKRLQYRYDHSRAVF
ncbi:hypothetical protein DICVIV_04691 [Dictyocaulus viviparus]|uniref:Uncharacterized protein n=1 Tax=Dictyocaulus viviparus TaxID=29172 RepID=A0A0D8XXJ0_DICVI|nr:hypothetical protein DICVIV_04691 [Dictyocaulus viviparus]